MLRLLPLGAALLALSACGAEFGAPDTSRGSADSPMTMMVDQAMNGVPRQGGSQIMFGPTTRGPGASSGRSDFGSGSLGGAVPVIAPQGGEKR